MQNRVCARSTLPGGSTSRWMTEHHAPRRIKISGPPPATRPTLRRRAARRPSLSHPPPRLSSRVGIKSATHQPSGYLKSLSVDRLRYRRCFVRELVAFVARLHDPSLASWNTFEERGRKSREKYIYSRVSEREKERLAVFSFGYITNSVLLDFLHSRKEEKEICVMFTII